MGVIEPKRILIASQCTGKEPYVREIEYLFKSLNLYGGKLANAQKIACFTEPVESTLVERLTKLGVKIKTIENLDSRYPYANKIQMLRLDQEEDFDLLVTLDTDIVIANDFSMFIDNDSIGGKPVDSEPLGLENWKNVFKYFEVKVPSERYLTCFTMVETIPWFNSGVLLIPRKFTSRLYDTWKSFIYKLMDAYYKLPEITENCSAWSHKYAFTDQFALVLAIQDAKLPYHTLPLEMNFPTHYNIHKNFKPDTLNPFLIHYHHRISKSGNIMHCSYENINRFIDKINLSLTDNLKKIEDYEIIVDDLYHEILHRSADEVGLQHYASLLESKKMSIEDIRRTLLNSDEYKSLAAVDSCFVHNDIGEEKLRQALASSEYPDILLKLTNISRNQFGWFTKNASRIYEYPWLIKQIIEPKGKIILDIGAGITPLPIYLAENGAKIITVDNHKLIRKLNEDRSSWNEWGFLDYSTINENIKSTNTEIQKTIFSNNYFDYIYSISVIEHIKANIRKEIWKNVSKWIKKNGMLLLTVDLVKGTEKLWNFSEDKIVDDQDEHGNLKDLEIEICENGFELSKCDLIRNIVDSRVDSAFLTFRKL